MMIDINLTSSKNLQVCIKFLKMSKYIEIMFTSIVQQLVKSLSEDWHQDFQIEMFQSFL